MTRKALLDRDLERLALRLVVRAHVRADGAVAGAALELRRVLVDRDLFALVPLPGSRLVDVEVLRGGGDGDITAGACDREIVTAPTR